MGTSHWPDSCYSFEAEMKMKLNWTRPVGAGFALLGASWASAIVSSPMPGADSLFPHVLVIGQMNNGTTRVTGGSVVIINHDMVLTAGHVSSGNNITNPNFVIYNGMDRFCTQQIFPPDLDGNGFPDVDIKILKFPPNTFSSWSPIAVGNVTGREVTLVGQGATGTLRANQTGFDVLSGSHNTRRVAKNIIEGYAAVSYFNPPSYQWSAPYFELDTPNGAPGIYPFAAVPNEGTFGPLDSGGAMYFSVGSTPYLIGNINFVWDGNGNYTSNFNQLLDYNDGGAGVDMNDPRVRQFLTNNGISFVTLKTLSGTLSAPGVTASRWTGADVEVTIRRSGTSQILESFSAKLGANGTFNYLVTASGTCDIFFKLPGALERALYSRNLNTNVTGQSVNLVMGDADGDNEITNADYSIWAFVNGANLGEPGYDLAIDFDRDTEITNADYSIWAFNNGQLGDLPSGP